MLQVSARTSSLNPLPGVITMRTNLSLVLSRAAIGALALSATPFLADAQHLTANRPVANVPSAARPISWASSAALPTARDHHVTFITSGTAGAWLYVGGGRTGDSTYSDAYRARVNGDGMITSWEAAKPLPGAFADMALGSDEDFVFLAGGLDANGEATNAAFIAPVFGDGRLGSWKATSFPLPAPRAHSAAVIANGYAYVIGGSEKHAAVSTVYRAKIGFGGVTGPWTEVASLPGARSHHAAIVRDGSIYVIAGNAGTSDAPKPLSDVIRATVREDGSLGEWTTLSTLDASFATHAAVVYENELYVMGGVENNSHFSDRVMRAAFLADGSLGAWQNVNSPLPAPRAHVHNVPVLGDRIFSVGGSLSGQATPDVVAGIFNLRAPSQD
jgi:hypothetical protein